MKKSFLLSVALSSALALVLSTPAGAITLDQFGTEISSRTANCPGLGCSGFTFSSDGGVGVTSSSTNVDESRAQATAFADLDNSGALAVPNLRARGVSR